MTNERFQAIWDALNALLRANASVFQLSDMSASGMIAHARNTKAELDEWCAEVAARSKAEFENAQGNHQALKEEFGEGFNEIKPNYTYGLHFGDNRKSTV